MPIFPSLPPRFFVRLSKINKICPPTTQKKPLLPGTFVHCSLSPRLPDFFREAATYIFAPICKETVAPWPPCAKGAGCHRQTEGLSVRFLIYYIDSGLSYPLRHFVTPPLTIRGGRGRGQNARATMCIATYRVSPVPCETVTVKTRRYELCAKAAEVRGECTQKYMTRRSRKADKAERCIYAFRPT